jgi:hypothetical protein
MIVRPSSRGRAGEAVCAHVVRGQHDGRRAPRAPAGKSRLEGDDDPPGQCRQSGFQVYYNLIDAVVVVIIIPIALLVLLAQRRIVSGLTAGSFR